MTSTRIGFDFMGNSHLDGVFKYPSFFSDADCSAALQKVLELEDQIDRPSNTVELVTSFAVDKYYIKYMSGLWVYPEFRCFLSAI